MARFVLFFGELEANMDGVTAQYPDWWCNVRPSNTEPLLRLNLEATNPAVFDEACAKVFAILGTPVGH